MDFQLNEEQRAIAEMADNLFSDLCTDDRLREVVESGETTMHDLWSVCQETGLHSLYIPESAGGSGLGMTELMTVLQAQGKGLGQVPLWRHQVAAAALMTFAPETFQGQAEQAANAEILLTLSQADASRCRGLALKAERTRDGIKVDGRVEALPEGGQAQLALVQAETPEGVRVLVLPLDLPGIERIEGVMTHGEAVADLQMSQICLPETHLLPEAAVSWLDQRSVAALASLQVGISEEQLRRTVEYVTERRQFDRQIGSFQAVQMSMADCRIALEALRSSLWQLVYRLDSGLPAEKEALSVSWQACQAGHQIGHKAQHVHGGFGVDLTYPMHRFLYWSRGVNVALGGSSATLERLGDLLADNDQLGWKYDLDEQ